MFVPGKILRGVCQYGYNYWGCSINKQILCEFGGYDFLLYLYMLQVFGYLGESKILLYDSNLVPFPFSTGIVVSAITMNQLVSVSDLFDCQIFSELDFIKKKTFFSGYM